MKVDLHDASRPLKDLEADEAEKLRERKAAFLEAAMEAPDSGDDLLLTDEEEAILDRIWDRRPPTP